MEIADILQQLERNTGVFPREALEQAIAQREQITPALLKILEDAYENINQIAQQEDYFAHIYAMYLLAQFREPQAYPLIVNFFAVPGEVAMDATGDIGAGGLGCILASVCAGDVTLIEGLIENANANEYVRGSALEALLILVLQGLRPRAAVVQYFQSLFRERLERQPSHVWGMLVSCSADLHPDELMADIRCAFADGLVDEWFIDEAWVEQHLAQSQAELLETMKQDRHHQLMGNVIDAMHWWACFQPLPPPPAKRQDPFPLPAPGTAPTLISSTSTTHPGLHREPAAPRAPQLPKVGRNDPCPCGSGKKYKHCCGARH
jgi:hypothetical protein